MYHSVPCRMARVNTLSPRQGPLSDDEFNIEDLDIRVATAASTESVVVAEVPSDKAIRNKWRVACKEHVK